MAQNLKHVLEDALALPEESRAFVAEALLESLEIGDDFPVSAAWQQEIIRRCRQIDEGEVALIPGDEAIESLKQRFS